MNSVTKYKFFGGLILILFLGASVIYGIRFYRDRADLKALADYNTYLDKFKNDTVGGKTPEETLKMFVAALKKGDVELASQYFSLDKNGSREKWLKKLSDSKNNFTNIINIVSAAKFLNSSYDGQAWFQYKDSVNQEQLIEMIRNGQVWKIESL